MRRHAARCRRCARHWRELEASERLLRRLPASVVDPGDRAGDRLAALSRWGPRPRPRPATGGAGLPALGAVAAAAALVVLLSLVGVSPKGVPSERPVLVSAVVPESNLIPDGWR